MVDKVKVTEDDFKLWLKDPVTERLMSLIDSDISKCLDALTSGNLLSVDNLDRHCAFILGKRDTYESIKTLTYDVLYPTVEIAPEDE